MKVPSIGKLHNVSYWSKEGNKMIHCRFCGKRSSYYNAKQAEWSSFPLPGHYICNDCIKDDDQTQRESENKVEI